MTLISVAPMLDCTDRHYRYLARLLSPNALLYTEMIHTGAILHGDAEHFLAYNPEEHPLALQLGGSNPEDLANASKIAAEMGYDEINLNVGCPSSRVQNGRFGACLMAEPELVRDCVAAMNGAVDIPVTVKTRIGIDDKDSYEELQRFIATVAEIGCERFIVHARKAWLKGLSPKENRTVPPLRYDVVYQLKQDFPHLSFIINGGIKTCGDVAQHLAQVDGVMIGREAYHNPYFLASLEQAFYDAGEKTISRADVLAAYIPYARAQFDKGVKLGHLVRPLFGLFQGLAGARHWRRYLSENSYQKTAGIDVILQAASELQQQENAPCT
ncbi:MAG: tRNA dihydrouridine(20/20a) synthase DusA [Legionellales bacterium]|mgnify:CR=1 FL=1|nr:tRNA dihydrouridine(20/20a) synthase DusA [Legionellales bacterium]|tara:strand:+ start:2959 stop:3939 length:981 start_codon:yes stop_codon:yes gene_type:complete